MRQIKVTHFRRKAAVYPGYYPEDSIPVRLLPTHPCAMKTKPSLLYRRSAVVRYALLLPGYMDKSAVNRRAPCAL